MRDFRYIYFLTSVEGLGSVRIKKLLETFSNPEDIFSLSLNELASVDGISQRLAESIIRAPGSFEEYGIAYEKLVEVCERKGIDVITVDDSNYPFQLKQIYDPPVILYVKSNDIVGMYNKLSGDSVGIVGTRRPSDYGKKMAETFAKELIASGMNVISGFARGIDTAAHKSVLSSNNNGYITGAVFGCGVDVVYPPENKNLYEEMCARGALISEYEPGTKPDAMNFPRRNRVISGLSRGIIVIESGKDGGALITARCALDQGREVFAVPGYVTSKMSEGANYLIKTSQAKLVENIDDVLTEFGMGKYAVNRKNTEQVAMFLPELSGNEKTIFDVLQKSADPLHIDAISEQTELNISDSLVTLSNLEFKGIVSQLPGKRFSIVK